MKNMKKLYSMALVQKVPILFSIAISSEASAFNDNSPPPVEQYKNSVNNDSNTFFIN
jgi:hypothetical protein